MSTMPFPRLVMILIAAILAVPSGCGCCGGGGPVASCEYENRTPSLKIQKPWKFPKDPIDHVVGSTGMSVFIDVSAMFSLTGAEMTVKGFDANGALIASQATPISLGNGVGQQRSFTAAQVALILSVHTRTLQFIVSANYLDAAGNTAAISDYIQVPKPPAIVIRPWVCPPNPVMDPVVLAVEVYPTPGSKFLLGNGTYKTTLTVTGSDASNNSKTAKYEADGVKFDPTKWISLASYDIDLKASTPVMDVLKGDYTRFTFTLVVYWQDVNGVIDVVEDAESTIKP